MRHHGRNGQILVDVSADANGATITALPFVAELNLSGKADKIDVTAMGDGNKVKLRGFKDFSGTASGYDDTDSDVYRIIGDGEPRAFMCIDDTEAETKKYWYGVATFDTSTSMGQGKAVSVSIELDAADTVLEAYDDEAPDFP